MVGSQQRCITVRAPNTAITKGCTCMCFKDATITTGTTVCMTWRPVMNVFVALTSYHLTSTLFSISLCLLCCSLKRYWCICVMSLAKYNLESTNPDSSEVGMLCKMYIKVEYSQCFTTLYLHICTSGPTGFGATYRSPFSETSLLISANHC